jgi:Rrf2 family protein
MISKTTISAVRALIFVAQNTKDRALSPRLIGEALGESPTYLAKVARHLVRAGILKAEKGVKGGVRLGRPADSITLLAVVEACQGTILGSYCQTGCTPEFVCAYHQAAVELQEAIIGVLSRWTLDELVQRSHGSEETVTFPCFIGIKPAMPQVALLAGGG